MASTEAEQIDPPGIRTRDEELEVEFDEDLEWELDEGIPQFEDPFIEKYMKGRDALIEQEKKSRHDRNFLRLMTPMAAEACRIVSLIRKKERDEIWTAAYEDELAAKNGGNMFPGMVYTLARDRVERTTLFEIVRRMPKGALLHAHMDAMVDTDWVIEQAITTEGMCMHAPEALASEKALEFAAVRFVYAAAVAPKEGAASVWDSEGYQPASLIPVRVAAQSFPNGGEAGFRSWLRSRCTITIEESLNHHHGVDAVWRKFQSCFPILASIIYYEPIFRASMQRMLAELATDGIKYVDFRVAFHFEYRRMGSSAPEKDYVEWFRAFGEEIEKFKGTTAGKDFHGARMIWTALRRLPNRAVVDSMKHCIAIKQQFPALLAGFDMVGQEDAGRPLADLTPLLFWFRKKCAEARIEIPFFFHAGECLGDGDETDTNLFDAILLGTRRIGHGFSIYKHPLLIEMVKEKRILVESCPISNEVLRLTSSVMTHPLPALLSRGVSVSLNNDDPAILGHRGNGLTHEFWQVLNGLENVGLEGLAVMAENSIRWAAVEDQNSKAWIEGIKDGVAGKGVKAVLLKGWEREWETFCAWVVAEFALQVDDEEDGE